MNEQILILSYPESDWGDALFLSAARLNFATNEQEVLS